MKAPLVIFTIAVALFALVAGCSPKQDAAHSSMDPVAGRFQLLHAVVESGSDKESVLFKIDTFTGETWRYTQMMFKLTNGTPVGCGGWSPIGDYGAAYDRLTKTVGQPDQASSEKRQ